MPSLDKLTSVRALLAVIATLLLVIAAHLVGSTGQAVAAPAPAFDRELSLTPLGNVDFWSVLLLDNRTGQIWRYNRLPNEKDRTPQGHAELWGRLNALGDPIKVEKPLPFDHPESAAAGSSR